MKYTNLEQEHILLGFVEVAMKINGLRTYYRDIKKNLHYSRREKYFVMKQIKNEISEYIESNDITEITKIVDHFGSAKELYCYLYYL